MSQLKLVAIIVLGTAGCTEGHPDPAVVGPRDSSGVAIVENAAALEHWRINPTPVWQLGGSHNDSTKQFFRVVAAARTADGSVVVVDGGSRNVRWYSPSGDLIATAGRRGEGPGEFLRVTEALHTPSGGVGIYDAQSRRVTWYSGRGELQAERPVKVSNVHILSAPGPDRIAFSTTSESHERLAAGNNYLRTPVDLLLIDHSDTILLRGVVSTESVVYLRLVDGRPTATYSMPHPFAPPPLIAVDDNGVIVVDAVRNQLDFYGWDGSLRRIGRGQVAPRLISRRDLEEYVEARVEAEKQRPNGNPAEVESGTRDLLNLTPAERQVPLFDHIVMGEHGIWLRHFSTRSNNASARKWSVFARDGRLLSTIDTPARFIGTVPI